MKTITLKRQLMFVLFLLLGTFYAQATDENLITQQTTINVDEAGTLSQKIGADIYRITNLKITGVLNGDDISTIRDMAGSDNYGSINEYGNLSVLDLTDASIIEGGNYYISISDKYICGTTLRISTKFQHTELFSIGSYMFFNCHKLTSLKLPKRTKILGSYTFAGCNNLTSIDNIPQNITNIEEGTPVRDNREPYTIIMLRVYASSPRHQA